MSIGCVREAIPRVARTSRHAPEDARLPETPRSDSSAAARRPRASVVFGAWGFALSEKWCGCAYGDASGGAARRATEAMASAREE